MLELCFALTTHLFLGGDWNDKQPCVRFTVIDFSIGRFLNSEDAYSNYLSYTFHNGPWFLEVGVADGYSYLPVTPMLRAGYEIDRNVRFFVVPAYDTDTDTFGPVAGVEFSFAPFR